MSVADILARNERLIAEYGHAAIHVFADPERGLPSFTYTVGLQDRGLPELILSGIPPQAAQIIVNEVAARLKEQGAPAEGQQIEGLLQGGYLARFRALSEAEIEANLTIACHRSADMGREPPEAFQIIYQDLAHRWPEDPAYACPLALALAQSREETRQ